MLFFATYGCTKFKKTKKRICIEASKFGFDRILSFSPTDLSNDFIENTKPFIHYSRGAGYWLWKAFVLKEVFSIMKMNDILVYLDAGCEINIYGKSRFREYISFMDSNKGVFSFNLNFKEYVYTNEETFKFFGINKENEIYNSNQLLGGILMFRKNYFTTTLINKFYNIATTRPDLFSDNYQTRNNINFIEHRHDQSIMSILKKLETLKSLDDESYFINWKDPRSYNVPFLAKRLRDPSLKYFLNFFKKYFLKNKKRIERAIMRRVKYFYG